MPVSTNESTADQASYGMGIDIIANPASGQSITFGGNVAITSISASGLISTGSSGVVLLQNVSGAATGGSGGTFSGKDPVGYIQIVANGALAKIPYFS